VNDSHYLSHGAVSLSSSSHSQESTQTILHPLNQPSRKKDRSTTWAISKDIDIVPMCMQVVRQPAPCVWPKGSQDGHFSPRLCRWRHQPESGICAACLRWRVCSVSLSAGPPFADLRGGLCDHVPVSIAGLGCDLTPQTSIVVIVDGNNCGFWNNLW
jgi:hypothetical protein